MAPQRIVVQDSDGEGEEEDSLEGDSSEIVQVQSCLSATDYDTDRNQSLEHRRPGNFDHRLIDNLPMTDVSNRASGEGSGALFPPPTLNDGICGDSAIGDGKVEQTIERGLNKESPIESIRDCRNDLEKEPPAAASSFKDGSAEKLNCEIRAAQAALNSSSGNTPIVPVLNNSSLPYILLPAESPQPPPAVSCMGPPSLPASATSLSSNKRSPRPNSGINSINIMSLSSSGRAIRSSPPTAGSTDIECSPMTPYIPKLSSSSSEVTNSSEASLSSFIDPDQTPPSAQPPPKPKKMKKRAKTTYQEEKRTDATSPALDFDEFSQLSVEAGGEKDNTENSKRKGRMNGSKNSRIYNKPVDGDSEDYVDREPKKSRKTSKRSKTSTTDIDFDVYALPDNDDDEDYNPGGGRGQKSKKGKLEAAFEPRTRRTRKNTSEAELFPPLPRSRKSEQWEVLLSSVDALYSDSRNPKGEESSFSAREGEDVPHTVDRLQVDLSLNKHVLLADEKREYTVFSPSDIATQQAGYHMNSSGDDMPQSQSLPPALSALKERALKTLESTGQEMSSTLPDDEYYGVQQALLDVQNSMTSVASLEITHGNKDTSMAEISRMTLKQVWGKDPGPDSIQASEEAIKPFTKEERAILAQRRRDRLNYSKKQKTRVATITNLKSKGKQQETDGPKTKQIHSSEKPKAPRSIVDSDEEEDGLFPQQPPSGNRLITAKQPGSELNPMLGNYFDRSCSKQINKDKKSIFELNSVPQNNVAYGNSDGNEDDEAYEPTKSNKKSTKVSTRKVSKESVRSKRKASEVSTGDSVNLSNIDNDVEGVSCREQDSFLTSPPETTKRHGKTSPAAPKKRVAIGDKGELTKRRKGDAGEPKGFECETEQAVKEGLATQTGENNWDGGAIPGPQPVKISVRAKTPAIAPSPSPQITRANKPVRQIYYPPSKAKSVPPSKPSFTDNHDGDDDEEVPQAKRYKAYEYDEWDPEADNVPMLPVRQQPASSLSPSVASYNAPPVLIMSNPGSGNKGVVKPSYANGGLKYRVGLSRRDKVDHLLTNFRNPPNSR